MASFKCETCKYETTSKSNLGIHFKSKKHCQLVGTPYEVKEIKNEVKEINKDEKIKELEMVIQNMKLQHENELLKQQLKHQEEMLVEKDKMLDYLMKSQPKIQSKVQQVQQVQPQVQPQVQFQQVQPQVQQVQPQVQPQVQVINEVPEVIKVSKNDLKEDDGTLNKKYLQKHCMTDSIGFCKDIEVIDDDYQLFMSGEYTPLTEVITQVLERNLRRITLHEMGCIVLGDKVYTHLDEWTESSKGLHHIRQYLAKQLELYLIEDETYEHMDKLGDEDYKGDLPTTKQIDQRTECTQLLLELSSQERHEVDKDIKLLLQKYSTK
jgi:hypothetical protein